MLRADTPKIIRHAWSVRLMALSGTVVIIEPLVGFVSDLEFPVWASIALKLLSGVLSYASIWARCAIQKEFSDE